VLSMLGKRVSARVNGGFLSLPWPSPTIAVSVIALFYADRIHFIPLIFSAVGIVVCFVANVNLSCYAIVEAEGDQFARGPHAGLLHSSIRRLLYLELV
jgi:Na+/H+ antiporter NhaA